MAGPGDLGQDALSLSGAFKTFGHVVALEDVDLVARSGEVLAVVGDNGAGKSTLLKVLAGVYRPDSGSIKVFGQPVHSGSPADARKHGVSTVFQDLALVETLDVAFNMFLGRQLSWLGIFANRRRMLAEAAETLRENQVTVPSVRVPIGELSGGQRQSVAIARAIRENNPIILLDEPTAALGVRETKNVGALIDSLKKSGKAVIIVSHDLEFVFKHCDRVQVMRLGRVHAVRDVVKTSREEIVGLITGAIAEDARKPSQGDKS
jgi:simple sugar transport system ATP-binding protein/D-xylose transport system ATP-binding protein